MRSHGCTGGLNWYESYESMTPSAAAGSAASATAAPSTSTPTMRAPLATAPSVGAGLAWFKAQEPVCAAWAKKSGNGAVDPARFVGAKELSVNSDGGYLIQDGKGDQLLVFPAQGRALPKSGDEKDTLPIDYEFGCPTEVFVGATQTDALPAGGLIRS